MGISQKRPSNTVILILGTPKRGTPMFGNPYIGVFVDTGPEVELGLTLLTKSLQPSVLPRCKALAADRPFRDAGIDRIFMKLSGFRVMGLRV